MGGAAPHFLIEFGLVVGGVGQLSQRCGRVAAAQRPRVLLDQLPLVRVLRLHRREEGERGEGGEGREGREGDGKMLNFKFWRSRENKRREGKKKLDSKR